MALAEAGADVAVVTLDERHGSGVRREQHRERILGARSQGIALTSDSGETTDAEAIVDATAELGAISIFVYAAPVAAAAPCARRLRSDPAIVVLIDDATNADSVRTLLGWTRELADAGLRANVLFTSRAIADAAGPVLKEHHAPERWSSARLRSISRRTLVRRSRARR